MSLVRTDDAPVPMGGGLIGIQRRYRELGRLRMGEKGTSQKGGSYPKKLADWRLTSQSKELLDVAAALYGGTVARWEGAPTEGVQWELRSGTDRLDVLVPPGQVLSQYFELWSGGGCVRRCNGMAQTTGEACACPADLELRAELSKDGKACKPTTRLSVILPRIPDIGVWRVESHGMNAAVEIPGTVDILRQALEGGVMIPAQLRMEQRTSKKDGETRHFVVPVLELPTVTIAALTSGGVQALSAASMPALEAGQPPAPPAPPVGATKPARAAKASRPAPPPLPPLPGSQQFTAADETLPAPSDVPLAEPGRISALLERIGRVRTVSGVLAQDMAREWKAQQIRPVSHPERFTVDDADAAEALVATFEEEAAKVGAEPAQPTLDAS